MYSVFINFIVLLTLFSCTTEESKSGKMMKSFDFKNPIQVKLTSKLNEISGLTNTKDGALFAINDEIGIVYKLDPENGKIIKRFFLGKWTAEEDFEGITTDGKYIYTISSNGNLFKFKEGENEKAVDYKVEKLPFTSKFDIEGLYFDEELDGLLLAAKEYAGKKYNKTRAIYFYSFNNQKVNEKPLFTISLKELKNNFGIKDFYPSGISKHPLSGNYFIISARNNNVIIEVEISGNVVSTKKLSEKKHRQPEGITFLNDSTMLISDEAAGKRATITKYIYKD